MRVNHNRGPPCGLAISGTQAGVAGSFAGHPTPPGVTSLPDLPCPPSLPGTPSPLSLGLSPVSSSADTAGEPLWRFSLCLLSPRWPGRVEV